MSDDNQKNQNSDNFELSVQDKRFRDSVEHGVMDDDLNYKRLFFWSSFIIIMVGAFLVALIELYDYSSFVVNDKRQEIAEFTQIQELKAEGTKQLNSYGVVDAEENIYHIPIDSAINIMAQDSTR